MRKDQLTDRPLGYQQIADVSASTVLTVPAGAILALIQPESQAVRWRDDGTAPTATVGYPLPVGGELEATGQLDRFKFIEQVSGAKLNVVYYGYPL